MTTSVVIPTRNEAASVVRLIERVVRALQPFDEIVFVDDGTDDLPAIALTESAKYANPIRVIRRASPDGGLGGAVTLGMTHAVGDILVVCDGDLQHPPEVIPALLAKLRGADVAVASRYCAGGNAQGLAGGLRRFASRATGLLSRALFPRKLRNCSDPMSGFFAVRREAVVLGALRPVGFKILLEILLRSGPLRIAEVPFTFAERTAGESHATIREGFRFLRQLTGIRLANRAALFMLVGASGVLPNLLVLALLHRSGLPYLVAAVVGTQAGIGWNFVGAEVFVWRDRRAGQWPRRFMRFVGVGETDLLRLPFVALFVEVGHLGTLAASTITFVLAFALRFTLADKIVYRRSALPLAVDVLTGVDEVTVVVVQGTPVRQTAG